MSVSTSHETRPSFPIGSGRTSWDFPDQRADRGQEPQPTALDRVMSVVKIIGAVLLFVVCIAFPDEGSHLPTAFLVVLGVIGAAGALLLGVGIVYQRHRSPALDRPIWEAEGRRSPSHTFTRQQAERGRFDVRDEMGIVATDRIGRGPSAQRGLFVGGRRYRVRRPSQSGFRLVADGESVPTVRVKGKEIILANGSVLTTRRAPSRAVLKDYRMRRITDADGQDVIVLRWKERPIGGRPVAEARLYGSTPVSELLPLVCCLLARFHSAQGR